MKQYIIIRIDALKKEEPKLRTHRIRFELKQSSITVEKVEEEIRNFINKNFLTTFNDKAKIYIHKEFEEENELFKVCHHSSAVVHLLEGFSIPIFEPNRMENFKNEERMLLHKHYSGEFDKITYDLKIKLLKEKYDVQ